VLVYPCCLWRSLSRTRYEGLAWSLRRRCRDDGVIRVPTTSIMCAAIAEPHRVALSVLAVGIAGMLRFAACLRLWFATHADSRRTLIGVPRADNHQ
jgi:hypothetical protein